MLSRQLTQIIFALMGAALLASAQTAMAAGTVAGTSISNLATVNYQISGVSQPANVSNTVSFVVDRKINLTAVNVDAAAVQVSPGSSDNVLRFTVTNTGNGTQDFLPSAIAVVIGQAAKFGGLLDGLDATATTAYVDSNGNGVYETGVDTATYIDELVPDASKTVFIVATFGIGLTNGVIASYHLLAQALAGGAGGSQGAVLAETGAETPGIVDTVFGDGQGTATASDASRDAMYSAQSDYVVQTANLTITKASTVISDPLNGAVLPKAIPGAVVEYTVTISNGAGGATVTSVTLGDSLAAEIVAGHLAFDLNTYAAGKGIRVTAPNINGGAALDLTNASDGDQGDWNLTTANTVTVGGIQLLPAESAIIKFRVTVQ